MTFRALADRKDKGEKKKKIGGSLGGWRVWGAKLFLGKDVQVKSLTFQFSSNG